MNWFSKTNAGRPQPIPSAHDPLESAADEGSPSMFTIIGPLTPHAAPPVPAAAAPPEAVPCPPYSERTEPQPVAQDKPIQRIMMLFDDTAYFNDTESLHFR